MKHLAAIATLFAFPAQAETLVAVRTLPAHTMISMSDLAVSGAMTPGALQNPADAVGLETRITLYAGRPIRPGDLGAPALVERNQIINLIYLQGNLRITAEGRALGRAAEGERLRVMNLSSRNTLFGTVAADGSVHVSN